MQGSNEVDTNLVPWCLNWYRMELMSWYGTTTIGSLANITLHNLHLMKNYNRRTSVTFFAITNDRYTAHMEEAEQKINYNSNFSTM